MDCNCILDEQLPKIIQLQRKADSRQVVWKLIITEKFSYISHITVGQTAQQIVHSHIHAEGQMQERQIRRYVLLHSA